MVQKTPLYLILILVLSLGLIFSVLLAVTFGSSPIPFSDVYRVILNQLFGIGDDAVYGTGPLHDIIIYIRLPRLILAVAVGMGLAVCGVVMQAIVKIPWQIPIFWACPPVHPWEQQLPSCWALALFLAATL